MHSAKAVKLCATNEAVSFRKYEQVYNEMNGQAFDN